MVVFTGGRRCFSVEFTEKQLKRSRILYIIEATVEYFISLLVAGSYLATITRELGLSDSLTGILSSMVSLGCVFKLAALAIRPRTVKRLATVLSIANQLLFLMLYVIPITPISGTVKTVVFVASLALAYVIFNLIEPHKLSWLMSLVEDGKRGRFTADKEIVSLISGMVFSFAMGTVMDHFVLGGDTRTAFIIAAIVLFTLSVIHTLTLLFTVEKELPDKKNVPLKVSVKRVLCNKNVLLASVVYIFHYLSNYAAVPFYGTYMIGELGFTLQFVSVLSIGASIVRVFVSRAWGRYADKNSFASMTAWCFAVLGLAYVCVVFATPGNGAVMMALYYILHGIAFGGVNSALTNLVFDYASLEDRAAAIGVSRAVAGVLGFFTTVAVSPFVAYVQENGNTLFGMSVYAQQVTSAFSAIVIFCGAIYAGKVLAKRK